MLDEIDCRWIVIFCFLLIITLNFIASFQTTIYYICVGKISNSLQQNVLSRGNVSLIFLSVIIHSAIYMKIWLHKRKHGGQIDQQTTKLISKMLIFKDIEKQSRLIINFLYWCIFVTSIFSAVKLSKEKMENLNIYPNYLLVYFTNLFAPCFYVFLLIASFYRNRTLRRAIFDEVKNLFA